MSILKEAQMPKKLFIWLPTSFKTEVEIRAKMGELKELFEEKIGIKTELIDSYNPNFETDSKLKLLAFSIEKMAQADEVLFAKGYKEADKCCLEFMIALECNNLAITTEEGIRDMLG